MKKILIAAVLTAVLFAGITVFADETAPASSETSAVSTGETSAQSETTKVTYDDAYPFAFTYLLDEIDKGFQATFSTTKKPETTAAASETGTASETATVNTSTTTAPQKSTTAAATTKAYSYKTTAARNYNNPSAVTPAPETESTTDGSETAKYTIYRYETTQTESTADEQSEGAEDEEGNNSDSKRVIVVIFVAIAIICIAAGAEIAFSHRKK